MPTLKQFAEETGRPKKHRWAHVYDDIKESAATDHEAEGDRPSYASRAFTGVIDLSQGDTIGLPFTAVLNVSTQTKFEFWWDGEGQKSEVQTVMGDRRGYARCVLYLPTKPGVYWLRVHCFRMPNEAEKRYGTHWLLMNGGSRRVRIQ